MGRLQIAMDAAKQARDDQNEFLASIHGFKIKKPEPIPATDEEFNQKARSAMAFFGAVKVEAGEA